MNLEYIEVWVGQDVDPINFKYFLKFHLGIYHAIDTLADETMINSKQVCFALFDSKHQEELALFIKDLMFKYYEDMSLQTPSMWKDFQFDIKMKIAELVKK